MSAPTADRIRNAFAALDVTPGTPWLDVVQGAAWALGVHAQDLLRAMHLLGLRREEVRP